MPSVWGKPPMNRNNTPSTEVQREAGDSSREHEAREMGRM